MNTILWCGYYIRSQDARCKMRLETVGCISILPRNATDQGQVAGLQLISLPFKTCQANNQQPHRPNSACTSSTRHERRFSSGEPPLCFHACYGVSNATHLYCGACALPQEYIQAAASAFRGVSRTAQPRRRPFTLPQSF